MAIDFPNAPAVNDTVTVGAMTWTWTGTAWISTGGSSVMTAFKTVAVSGQSDVVADAPDDILTLASSDIAITTNASTDTVTLTLATVNSNVGTFGSSIEVPVIAANAKGLITSVSNVTIRTGSTTQTGVLQLTDSTSSTSTTTAATPASVKSAYDLAIAALPLAGGTMTGSVTLRAGTATAGTAPLYLASGTNLTAAAAGAVEWNGTNLFITQTTGPTRKTVAFTDSNITGTSANVTGTVAVGNGGTGATTLTGYVKGSGTSAMTASATVPASDISGTLGVANGGTGATTLTGYVKGTGTAALTGSSTVPATDVSGTLAVANGGTGQSTYVDGELLIGNTTGNTLTKATLTGTTNQVAVTNGAGSIALSLPQNIHTAATPTFASATLNNATGPQLSFTGATSKWITWTTGGAAAPSFTTRSVGTKLVLWDGVTPTTGDFAIGIEDSNIWNSVPGTTGFGFKWYGGTTNIATLTGTGNLSISGTLTHGGVTNSPLSSGATAPTSPVAGQMWWDTATSRLKMYTGTAWKIVAGNWPRIHCRNSTTFTITNTGTHPWNVEDEKVDITHSTSSNNGQFTIASGLGGIYMVSYSILPYGGGTVTPTTWVDINTADTSTPANDGSVRRFAQVAMQNYNYATTPAISTGAARGFSGTAWIKVVPGDVLRLKCSDFVGSSTTWGIASRTEISMFEMIMVEHIP